MVMSGSGNLKVLQLCRFLHKRTFGEMNYGFHMAHHMALGLLFLGGGRYHLQALRHLAVLAAEPRLLVPVDVDSLKPCYALLDVTYKETQWYEETTVELMAPTMLPELHLLKRIKVKGPRYWELNIDISKGTQHLQSILSKDGVLYVKLRAGQLPYKDDPQGWKSLLAPNLNNRSAEVRTFKKQETVALLSAILYECVTQEYPEMLPTHISIDQAVRTLERGDLCETFSLWQMKLVLELCESRVLQQRLRDTRGQGRGLLLSSEFLPVMKSSADRALDRWLCVNSHVLQAYLRRQTMNNDTDVNMLACFLVYHSIPSLKNMVASDLEGHCEERQNSDCRPAEWRQTWAAALEATGSHFTKAAVTHGRQHAILLASTEAVKLLVLILSQTLTYDTDFLGRDIRAHCFPRNRKGRETTTRSLISTRLEQLAFDSRLRSRDIVMRNMLYLY
ncbi:anaphase-promoting complex subunit 1-like protein [Labeo rohita]|uniref:Anaphase-promoting complex subunit 1-like protein n=1 Tax=Labeo rohita TaxID=84645 RepID=A0A498LP88_LABRO|nr:anaphase-promoting complex subunit 1-like protein [Labeo rohita]